MGHELMQQAQAGHKTTPLKVKSHVGIHNVACMLHMSRHFDYDLFDDYTQPQQAVQVQTAQGQQKPELA